MEAKDGLLLKYFDLSPHQIRKFEELRQLYLYWNEQINLISRKDMDHLEEHHFLHSLSIAKVLAFKKGTRVLDVGTGGGFPGIPLSIFFPDVEFTLVDSIGKKIKVVDNLVQELGLTNVQTYVSRAENLPLDSKFDFVVSRAVTRFAEFWPWINKKFLPQSQNIMENGLLALKGGDLEEEIREFGRSVQKYPIKEFFEEEFFDTKQVLYVPHHGRAR